MDRYKAAKVREREQGLGRAPALQPDDQQDADPARAVLDAALRYELIANNPVKTKVEKLKEAEPRRVRLTGPQVQVLLQEAGEHRTLIATAIMAGGLRISELVNLRWRDLDLREGILTVAASKTAAGSARSSSSPSWCSSCASTSAPPSGASPPTSFSPVASASSRASARPAHDPARLHRRNRDEATDPARRTVGRRRLGEGRAAQTRLSG